MAIAGENQAEDKVNNCEFKYAIIISVYLGLGLSLFFHSGNVDAYVYLNVGCFDIGCRNFGFLDELSLKFYNNSSFFDWWDG